jgi:hypothetical protein
MKGSKMAKQKSNTPMQDAISKKRSEKQQRKQEVDAKARGEIEIDLEEITRDPVAYKRKKALRDLQGIMLVRKKYDEAIKSGDMSEVIDADKYKDVLLYENQKIDEYLATLDKNPLVSSFVSQRKSKVLCWVANAANEEKYVQEREEFEQWRREKLKEEADKTELVYENNDEDEI